MKKHKIILYKTNDRKLDIKKDFLDVIEEMLKNRGITTSEAELLGDYENFGMAFKGTMQREDVLELVKQALEGYHLIRDTDLISKRHLEE